MYPRLLYGSEAWYTGSHYGLGPAIDKAEKTVNSILRRTLGMKATTPTTAMKWELGLQPVTDILDDKYDRWAHKLGTMGKNNIVTTGVSQRKTPSNWTTHRARHDLEVKWKIDKNWDPREMPLRSPKKGHLVRQNEETLPEYEALVTSSQDPTSKGFRAEYTVTKGQGPTLLRGAIRTGEFTNPQDAEILATAVIIKEIPAKVTITTSTKEPVEALREPTTSLDHAEQIREEVKIDRVRMLHRPGTSLEESDAKVCRELPPTPVRYTSQAYVANWMARRKTERERKQLEGLPETYKKLGVDARTKKMVTIKHPFLGAFCTKSALKNRKRMGASADPCGRPACGSA